MSCCLASHVGVMTQRAQTGHVGLRMVALEWLFFSLSSDKCVVMFYITLTVDWTICSGFLAHMVQIGITRRSQSKVDRPASIPYYRTPWLHLSHGALVPCRNADRETQSMQTLCLHHSCYHNTSSHHYFLPRPWCSSLLTGLPVSALVPPLSHSPASSESVSEQVRWCPCWCTILQQFPISQRIETHICGTDQPHPTWFSPLPTESKSQSSFSPSHHGAQTCASLSVWGSPTFSSYSHHSSSVADFDPSDLNFNVFRVFTGAFSGHQIQQYPLPSPKLLQSHSMPFL